MWVVGWWIPLHYLVTSENDFRLSEAVTIVAFIFINLYIVYNYFNKLKGPEVIIKPSLRLS